MSSVLTDNAWRVRHEGSPKSIDNLTAQQVADGLQERLWEPTDEVRGPSDSDWVAIENHPQFEELASEIEPPPPRVYDDESRLDMNALIDVCLVLLVFFILTTSYAALTKRMDAPNVDATNPDQLKKVEAPEVEKSMIVCKVTLENGTPVYRIEDQVVSPDDLVVELSRRVGKSQKDILLLQHDPEVTHGDVVRVQDAASGAGISKVLVVVPDK